MSDHRGRNGIALGLVVGIGLTVLGFLAKDAISPPIGTDPNQAEQATSNSDEADNGNANDFDWWRSDGGLITSKDTLAQWIMALFGVVAVGVSAYAVLLIGRTLRLSRRTLTATQEMTRETTRIGEAQVRAYLHIS